MCPVETDIVLSNRAIDSFWKARFADKVSRHKIKQLQNIHLALPWLYDIWNGSSLKNKILFF